MKLSALGEYNSWIGTTGQNRAVVFSVKYVNSDIPGWCVRFSWISGSSDEDDLLYRVIDRQLLINLS